LNKRRMWGRTYFIVAFLTSLLDMKSSCSMVVYMYGERYEGSKRQRDRNLGTRIVEDDPVRRQKHGACMQMRYHCVVVVTAIVVVVYAQGDRTQERKRRQAAMVEKGPDDKVFL
jgi:hypothetical protein